MKTVSRIVVMSTLVALALTACGAPPSRPASGPFNKVALPSIETLSYRLTTASGATGKTVFRIAKDKRAPFGYVFTNTASIPNILDTVAVSRVKRDLRPVSTDVKIKNPGGLFQVQATYSNSTLKIDYPGSSQPPKNMKIVVPTYDFGEFLTLLRILKFDKGARYTVREAWPSFGQIFDSKIKVLGIENVQVPAGTFRAYHVTHTFGTTAEHGRVTEYNSWYEAAAPHRLIKHDNGSVLYELLPAER